MASFQEQTGRHLVNETVHVLDVAIVLFCLCRQNSFDQLLKQVLGVSDLKVLQVLRLAHLSLRFAKHWPCEGFLRHTDDNSFSFDSFLTSFLAFTLNFRMLLVLQLKLTGA